MSAFLVECPACHISFPVDSETMRVVEGRDARTVAAINTALTSTSTAVADFAASLDRCRDLSCRCNQEPEPAA